VNAVDVKGLTPLHIAARENYNGQNFAAGCLLALGADAGIMDYNGNSYEDLATQRHQMQSRFSEVIASSTTQEVRQALGAAIFSNRGSLEEMNAVLAAVESCGSEEERKALLDRLAEGDVGTEAVAARETIKQAYIAKMARNAAEIESEFDDTPGVGAGESVTLRITDGIGGGAKKKEKKRKKKKKKKKKNEKTTKEELEAETTTKEDLEAETTTKEDLEAETTTKEDLEAETTTKEDLEAEMTTKQDLGAEKKAKGTKGAKGVISRLPVEWMMQRARAMASCEYDEEREALAAGMEAHLPAEEINRLLAVLAACNSKKDREAVVAALSACGSYEEINEGLGLGVGQGYKLRVKARVTKPCDLAKRNPARVDADPARVDADERDCLTNEIALANEIDWDLSAMAEAHKPVTPARAPPPAAPAQSPPPPSSTLLHPPAPPHPSFLY
jgi:hypothetical protein